MQARRDRARRPTLLVCALLCGVAAAARAEAPVGSLVPELRLGAGYDDNLFLDAFPSGPTSTTPTRDVIFDVEPRLLTRLGVRGHALSLSIDDLERFTLSSGHLRDLAVSLRYRSAPLGRAEIHAGLGWNHWDVTLFPDNRNEVALGDLGLRVALVGSLEGMLTFNAAVRVYPTRAQVDVDLRPVLLLRLHLPRRFAIEAGYTFYHLMSTEPLAALDRHTPELGFVGRPVDWLGLRAVYAFSAQHLPYGGTDSGGQRITRDDLRHEVRLVVALQPLRWLEIFAEYELLYSSSNQPTGRFQRDQVIGGLTAWGLFTRPLRRPLTPTVEGDRRVTFRWRGKAQRVSVVGDWNDWDPEASPLQSSGGIFIGTYELPPGRRMYAFCVDGVVEAPPDANAYTNDGFGGRNGVVIVP